MLSSLLAASVFAQNLAEIPSDLSFSCDGRTYGYYADPQTNCQVFHICPGGGGRDKWSFLCPNQTIFNQVFAHFCCCFRPLLTVSRRVTFFQQYFVCDYAVNVDCLAAESYYLLNDNFGRIPEKNDDEFN